MTAIDTAIATSCPPPRARGAAHLSVKAGAAGSVLDGLRMSGSLKLVFPRPGPRALQAVAVNTAGGVTGGDRFETAAEVGPGCALVMTSQAAERAYRATDGEPGRIVNRLGAGEGAGLAWLPQETILFDGARLDRRLRVDLAADARFLMVEPVIFGRAAMGEVLRSVLFRDRVEVWRDGRLIWLDALRLGGDVAARLARSATGRGAGAMASVVYVAPDAGARRDALRALLPQNAGASCPRPGVLAARFLARDGFDLRAALLPALRLLHDDDLPRPWML